MDTYFHFYKKVDMQKMMYQIDKYASFYRMCIKVLWKEFVSHGMHIQECQVKYSWQTSNGKLLGYPFIVGISNEET